MSESRTIFLAIEDFVKSLEEAFPSSDKKNPLQLYSKMIDIIKREKDESIRNSSYEKAMSGFRAYFTSNNKSGNICYGTSNNVYLAMSKFFKTDSATRQVIESHLSNIRTLMGIAPAGSGAEGISGIFKEALGEDANTEDGQALQKVAEKIGSVVQNFTSSSEGGNVDPMAAIGALMADNSLEEMMSMFNGKKNNKLVRKLFNSILDKALPDESETSNSLNTLQLENSPTVIGVESVPTSILEPDEYADSTKAEAGSDE